MNPKAGHSRVENVSAALTYGISVNPVNISDDKTINSNQSYGEDSSKKSFCFNVKEPIKLFIGREYELINLHEMIQQNHYENESPVPNVWKITAITGSDGIGKSELSKMYAHKYAECYSYNVIWINAESHATMSESFIKLAKDELSITIKSSDDSEKSVELIIKEVYGYFRNKLCLFIFDNAEQCKTSEECDGINEFLPSSLSPNDNKPFILITSRSQKWGYNVNVINLSTFTEIEAQIFTTKALNVEINNESDENMKTLNAIKVLAQTLHYYPLALQLATAYIREENDEMKIIGKFYTINNYIDDYSYELEKTKRLFEYRSNDNCGENDTFTIINITCEKIKKKIHGNTALTILNIIAYFASENIPMKIFSNAFDEKKLINAMKLLNQYSMINIENGEINIHRFIQKVLQLKLSTEIEVKYLRKALKLLYENLEKKIFGLTCIYHAQSVWNYGYKYKTIVEEFCEFPCILIEEFRENMRLYEAYEFAERAVPVLEKICGNDHRCTLKAKNEMGNIMSDRGQYDEALQLFKEVYQKRIVLLGPEHRDTLLTQNNIAVVMEKMGKFQNAIQLYNDVYKKLRTQLNHDDPIILLIQNNMAMVMQHLGQYNDAMKLFQMVYESQKIQLGPEHSDTLSTQNNIALVMEKLGQYENAIRVFREVYDKQKTLLGPEHPVTLHILNNIGVVMDRCGQYKEAIKVYEEVYEKRKIHLGDDHPDTLKCQNNIALSLQKFGRYEEAIELFRAVHRKQIIELGSDHLETLETLNNIATILGDSGKYTEAIELFEEICEKQMSQLGPEHPNILTIQNNIAFVLHKLGKLQESIELLQSVYEKQKIQLGKDHSETLRAENNLGVMLSEFGKFRDAMQLLEEVYNKRKVQLGDDHPDTLDTIDNLAMVKIELQLFDEAIELLEKVYSKRRIDLGPDNLDTLRIMNNMGLAMHKSGRNDEAIKLLREVYNKRKIQLGEDHPDTFATLSNMAMALSESRKYEEAIRLLKLIHEKLKAQFGSNHLDTIRAQTNIAMTMAQMGKYNDAIALLQESYEKFKNHLGPEHPDTLEVKNNMQIVIEDLEQIGRNNVIHLNSDRIRRRQSSRKFCIIC